MQKTAPIVLRLFLSGVMLWFGFQQIIDANSWLGYLPAWTSALPISAVTFVHINGTFEVIFGFLLLFGFYVRFVALILALHLFGIAYTVGYDAIGVRDFGLAGGVLSVFFYGKDAWSVDTFFR